MKSFLRGVADHIRNDRGGDYRNVVILTPNRRAGLFLQKEINQLHSQPIWSPRLFTIDDWVRYHTDYAEADRLTCIYHLYKIWLKKVHSDEKFENFYFWGDRLIQDFDLIDKYLVNEKSLFSNLLEEKEIEAHFNDWEDELKAYLNQFWSSIRASDSKKGPGKHEQIDAFLGLWGKLAELKVSLKNSLNKDGLAYSGLMYRELAENPVPLQEWKDEHIYLVGFNRLNRCEEKIIEVCLSELNARIYWNIDEQILDRNEDFNDAMRFIKKRPTDEISASHEFSSDLIKHSKHISFFGIGQQAGQAKFVGDILSKSEVEAEATMIVLPDESLLLPILGALPEEIEKVNVSMGVALKETPMFSLMESYLKLHENYNEEKDTFQRVDLVRLLEHPYLPENNTAFEKVWISSDELEDFDSSGVRNMLKRVERGNAIQLFDNFLNGLKELHPWHAQKTNRGGGLAEYNAEVIVFAYQRIQRLKTIYEEQEMQLDFTALVKLIRHYFRNARIPFKGEPLEGLQILGPLEARNLDFRHLIIPNLNEGIYPGTPAQSIIPFHLQKAFKLPTYEEEMAEYAYYFYMALSRSDKASFLFNLLPDITGGKEMSRLLQNLDLLDTPNWKIEELTQAQQITLEPAPEISIDKDEKIIGAIQARFQKGVSPSEVYTYNYCTLQYYFKYIEKLREDFEEEEGYTSLNIGKVLHKSMELLYSKHEGKAVTKEIILSLKNSIDKSIEASLMSELGVDLELDGQGEMMLVRHLVHDFIQTILDFDEKRAPFILHGHEIEIEELIELENGRQIKINGRIDRLDEENGQLKVLDYKTGNVGYRGSAFAFNRLRSIDELFSIEKDTHKEALQLFLYAAALRSSERYRMKDLNVGLYALQDMGGNLQYDPYLYVQARKNQEPYMISSVSGDLLKTIKEGLEEWTQHLLDPQNSFIQAEDKKKCKYCPYNQICKRKDI